MLQPESGHGAAPITVQIADREELRRIACAHLLEADKGIQIVGEARNGSDAVSAAEKLKPHVLLLGLNMLKGKKIALLLSLRQKSPGTKIILLTRRVTESRIVDALSYGALGYINEKAISTFLLKAVRLVEAGEAWVPRKILSRITERLSLLGRIFDSDSKTVDQEHSIVSDPGPKT